MFKDYDDALEAVAKFDEQVKSLQRAIANAKKKGADEPSQSSQDNLKAELKRKEPSWKRRGLRAA